MKAVILAGGEGSRLRPLTRNRPKVMIPVANKPIIDYVINALVVNGIRDITVVVGYQKEQVIRHLNQLELPITVVVQEKQLGAAHALKCAEAEVDGDFLLLPGDNFIDAASVARIKDAHDAMLVKHHPSPSDFGVVVTQKGYVTDIIEKPKQAPGFTVSTGIFSLDRNIFRYLYDREIPDALRAMISEESVKFQAIEAETWRDAIYPWDLLSINTEILAGIESRKSGELRSGVTISGRVRIGGGTKIGPNTTIMGPAVIGDNCEIGPQAVIMPNTSIGSRVRIAPFSILGNAILMDDVSVGSHSVCTDAVIGEGTRLAHHTTTHTGVYTAEENGKIVKGKFGAIVGDRSRTMPMTVLRHCIVGNSVVCEEGRTLTGWIPDNVVVR
jgi:UDP-N-acetylglucosamine diphosphorylase/glucosamine-1-phosphate N-acetyltransferase